MFYPQLFRSGKIGTMEVKNRIVMPAMEVFAAGFSDAIFESRCFVPILCRRQNDDQLCALSSDFE